MTILVIIAEVLLTIFFSLSFLGAILRYEERGLWPLFCATINFILMIILIVGG